MAAPLTAGQLTRSTKALMSAECGKKKTGANPFKMPDDDNVILIRHKEKERRKLYSLAVKRGEIEKLEKMATDEEKKLTRAEQFLEKNAVMFDEFLRENDKNSVEAIKVAELETKVKMEKVAETKKITARILAIRSEISKFEDILKEYAIYKDFLFRLSPPEWQEAQRTKTKDKSGTKDKLKEKDERANRKIRTRTESRASDSGRELPPIQDARAPSTKSAGRSEKLSHVAELETDSSEYEEDPKLYFKDPRQLLDLLTELEEQNLSLIQNSRETEEALEEFRQVMDHNRNKMEMETHQLTQQIDTVTHAIHRETERADELELMSRLFNFGNFKSDHQEGMLDSLHAKVADVYRACVGDSEANLSTLQMLTAIENRLGELQENVELIPKDRLLLAERAKERERRLRLRDDKMHQVKQHQEERLRKALERAQADIKKKDWQETDGQITATCPQAEEEPGMRHLGQGERGAPLFLHLVRSRSTTRPYTPVLTGTHQRLDLNNMHKCG
ncbi:cilia- and flagella-associated protein 100 isoform X2 [Esox lucius]|uniref:cilia- and flagella-associated protein 100 isoform X2 n=1 Tax=Esox lucius TaxID=8010 RepID=UPI00147737FB|nr:cilia- and flagella-associated protein 100 isoform X2 [Esox lucius]